MMINCRSILFFLFCQGIIFSENVIANTVDSTTLSSKQKIEEVVVTGQYTPQSIGNSVYKVRVITNEKILAKAANNVQQILNTELGIRFSQDQAMGVSTVSIMGMSGRSVKVLIDGIPIPDRGDVREALNQTDVALIDKIEIVEGPMSTIYGTDALAGVINIITKKNNKGGFNASVRIHEETVGSEYGWSEKGLHQQNVNAQYQKGMFSIMGNVSHYDFKGFGGDQYNRNHNWKPKEQWIFTSRIGFQDKNNNISYRPDFLKESISTLTPINIDNYKGSNKTFLTNRFMHQLQGMCKFSDRSVFSGNISYTDYERITETYIKNFSNGDSELSQASGDQDRAFNDVLNARGTLVYTFNNKLTIQPGIEYTYETAEGDRMTGKHSISDVSIFATAEWKPNSKWNIKPGVRFTKNSLYDAPPIIPSLSVLYNINDLFSWRASYSNGYRAPSLRELYFDFMDANHNLKGNENLKAEVANSWNTSVSYKNAYKDNRIITSELSFFYNVYNQLIDFANNPDQPTEYIYVNIADYKTTGIQFRNRYIRKRWEISVNYLALGQYNSISEVKDLSENVPTFNWSSEVGLDFVFRIANHSTINLFYKFTGKRTAYQYAEDKVSGQNIVSLSKIDPFHNADLSYSYQYKKALKCNVGIRNLFDVQNIRNAGVNAGVHSSGSSIAFGYGRSFFAGVQYTFSK